MDTSSQSQKKSCRDHGRARQRSVNSRVSRLMNHDCFVTLILTVFKFNRFFGGLGFATSLFRSGGSLSNVSLNRRNFCWTSLVRICRLRSCAVITKDLADECLDMFGEVAEQKDEYEVFHEQFLECRISGSLKDSVDDSEMADLLRPNTSKSGNEQSSLKEYVYHAKKGRTTMITPRTRVSMPCPLRRSENGARRTFLRYFTTKLFCRTLLPARLRFWLEDPSATGRCELQLQANG